MHPQTLDASVPIILSVILLAAAAMLAIVILMVVAMWKVYQKAGRKGWESIIPFYNYVVMLELTNEPLWWIALLFVPFANIVVAIIVLDRMSRAFGHGAGFTVGLLFLPFVFWPILAFGSSSYSNTFPPAPDMKSATKWALAAGAFYALIYVFMYFSLLTSISNFASASTHSLTVIKSDGSDGNIYATDGRYVYANDQIVQGADPETFQLHGSYAVDQDNVYYAAVPIAGADVQTFRVLSGDYAIDSQSAYYGGVAITDADVQSFKSLDEEYAVDSNNAYHYGDVIPNADPGSFSVLGSSYAEDQKSVYYSGDAIVGADPQTFALAEDPSGHYNYDARDKNHLYSAGQVVGSGK